MFSPPLTALTSTHVAAIPEFFVGELDIKAYRYTWPGKKQDPPLV